MKEDKKKENMVEDIHIGRFSELATSNKTYVNNLNLHEIKKKFYKVTQAILS